MRDRGEERERARARDCVCEREREKEIGEKGERESLFPFFLTHLPHPPPPLSGNSFWINSPASRGCSLITPSRLLIFRMVFSTCA